MRWVLDTEALVILKAELQRIVKKPQSKEQDVRALVAEVINATGMKDEHLVDCPAIPITHVFVEFEDTRTTDRFVRSVNMRSYELDGRIIKISTRKDWGTSNMRSTKKQESNCIGYN